MSTNPLAAAVLAPTTTKRERLLHLVVVFSISFGVPIYLSISEFLGRHVLDASTAPVRLAIGNIRGFVALLIMYLLLHRQGRTMREIVGNFKWTDMLLGAALAFLTRTGIFIFYLILDLAHWMRYGTHAPWWDNPVVAFGSHLTAASFLFLLNNPLGEEVISRAYVIAEVEALSKSTEWAVLTCFVLQFICHLYQGIWNAAIIAGGMLCFSIYYVKKRRAAPNIFGHFYLDAWFLLRG